LTVVAQAAAPLGWPLEAVWRSTVRGVSAAVAARIRPLIETYADVMQDGYDLGQGLRGTVHIGYYAPVAPAFLPPILQGLRSENPDLRFDLQECDNITAQSGLLEGKLDIAIFAGDELLAGVDTRPLMDLPPYILAPEGHPLSQRAKLSLKDLQGVPLVLLDLPVAGAYVRRQLRAAGVAPDITATCSSVEMVRSLVGAGAGVAVLNMRPRTMQSYAGDSLRTLPLTDGEPLHLVSGRAAGTPRRLVQMVQDHLHTWFASPQAKELVTR